MSASTQAIASHEQFSSLIGKIYEASLDPAGWQQVLNDIVAFLAGNAGHFFTPMHMPQAGGFSFTVNVPDTFVQQYTTKYHRYDLWAQAGVEKGLMTSGTVVADEDLVPRRKLVSSRFYREFLKPSDTARGCMTIVFGIDSRDTPVTCVSVYRPLRAKPFSATAKKWMQLLNPHVSRSLGITFRLQDANFAVANTHAALDRIKFGVVLLDASGTVTFANRAASELLKEGSALTLRHGLDGRDRVVSTHSSITTEIDSFIASALSHDAVEVDHFVKSMPIPRKHNMPPLLLNVSALPFENSFGRGNVRAGAIMFITDAAQPLTIDPALMNRLFRLTEAEISLVRALCAGHALADVAARRCVSLDTVRSQLKSVFAKTQTHRQADLVRLLLGLSSTR